jgi:diacylglycerol kinase family enzyme
MTLLTTLALPLWGWACILAALVALPIIAYRTGKSAGRKSERLETAQRTIQALADLDERIAASSHPSRAWESRGADETPRVAVVLNPSKNDADRALKQIRLACASRGWAPPLVLETTVEDAGASQARLALKRGSTLILSAGGDGTVREVATVLSDESLNPGRVPMGIVPLGTGNLLARNLDIDPSKLDPKALDSAIDAALEGRPRRIDTAEIDIEHPDGSTTSGRFLVMGGIGLDAEVIAATSDDLKKKVGWLAYTDAGIRLLPGKRKDVEVSLNGGPYAKKKIRSILFANLGKLPTGLDFVPGAEVDDGHLSIVTMSPRGVLGWAWIAVKTISRYKADIPVMTYDYATRISVRTQEPMSTQLDGDLSGEAVRLEAHIIPRSLTVHVPVKEPSLLARLTSSGPETPQAARTGATAR